MFVSQGNNYKVYDIALTTSENCRALDIGFNENRN